MKNRIHAALTHANLLMALFANAFVPLKDVAETDSALKATNAALLAALHLVEPPAAANAQSRVAASLADALLLTNAALVDAQQPREQLADANALPLAAALRDAARQVTPAV